MSFLLAIVDLMQNPGVGFSNSIPFEIRKERSTYCWKFSFILHLLEVLVIFAFVSWVRNFEHVVTKKLLELFVFEIFRDGSILLF